MLDSLLSPAARASLHGTTDSERYLALIRQELHTGPDLPTAVGRAISTLRGSFPHASLNALILTENTFIAVHASATSAAPVEDMLVSGIGHEALSTWLGLSGIGACRGSVGWVSVVWVRLRQSVR